MRIFPFMCNPRVIVDAKHLENLNILISNSSEEVIFSENIFSIFLGISLIFVCDIKKEFKKYILAVPTPQNKYFNQENEENSEALMFANVKDMN